MLSGLHPWADTDPTGSIYSLVCFSLGAGVIAAIAAEFLRGAGVVRTQTGKNLLSAAVLLTRRNTRRYGGYIIHFGIVIMFIGLAGAAFNQSKEMEMGFGDSIQVGGYKVVCQSFSQDSTPEYDTDFALLDVFHNGTKITRLTPERRIYFPDTDHAQASTVVAIHSTLAADLYVVFEGRNADSGRPIIKVFRQSAGQLDLGRRRHRHPRHTDSSGPAFAARLPSRGSHDPGAIALLGLRRTSARGQNRRSRGAPCLGAPLSSD